MSSPCWERDSASSSVLQKSKWGIRRWVELTKALMAGRVNGKVIGCLGMLEMGVRVATIPGHQNMVRMCRRGGGLSYELGAFPGTRNAVPICRSVRGHQPSPELESIVRMCRGTAMATL
jgi:hypothetical protein